MQSVRFLDSFLVKMLEEEGMVKWENYARGRRKRYMIKKRGCSRTEKQFYRQEMAEAPKTEVPALDEVRFGGCFI